METTIATDIEQAGPIKIKAIRKTSSLYAWYCLFVLLGIYVNSFLDRSILALLVGPIRSTVGLSDSQMGFLMGPAFAVFYTIAGLPLGWLADRMSRLTLIAVGQVFWTLSTVAFGFGRTWTHLAIARCNVGIGEATLTPSAHSLISDLFPSNQIGRAMSVYGMGIYIGSGLASLIGGMLTHGYELDKTHSLPFIGTHLGWQIIFFVVALPTIPLTLLLLTLREPSRKNQVMAVNAAGEKTVLDVPFSMFLSHVWQNRGTLFCHTFGFACLALSGYGAAAWMPEFFIRIHGWSPARAGTLIGLATIISGPLGIILGGILGDKLAQRGRLDSKMRVSMYAALGWLPFGILGPLVATGELAYLCMIPALFFSSMHWGIAPAAIQEIMPNQMRGQASALYLFVISLIGLGLGPMVLALVTDYVFQDDQQIHYSLLLTTTTATILGIFALAWGLPRYRQSRTRYEQWLKDCS
ncbi:MAG TPA: MFS transporter [Oligoflexus sp.]|uniref:spinster family MFS transporter n=1 Tax=Oligoflexus sp. TaxID=1971216 RepID=UPI002D2BEB5E|nr:MFS transporter [Oligoflexus sp.]HYX32128.1 MFS transporter [Oligoflexus sp.]